MHQAISMTPLAHVVGGRAEPTDDYWGGTESIIRIDGNQFGPDATEGLEQFSHLEVVFHFHLTPIEEVQTAARRPRDNPAWPVVGIFGHRNMRRPNRVGVSRCRLLKIDGLDLHVQDLDAVDGTPILDIKPWFAEFGPRGATRQADWATQMLTAYFAPPAHGPAIGPDVRSSGPDKRIQGPMAAG